MSYFKYVVVITFQKQNVVDDILESRSMGKKENIVKQLLIPSVPGLAKLLYMVIWVYYWIIRLSSMNITWFSKECSWNSSCYGR